MSALEVQLRLAKQARGEVWTKRVEVITPAAVEERIEYDAHAALDKLAKIRRLYEPEGEVLGRILVVRSAEDYAKGGE